MSVFEKIGRALTKAFTVIRGVFSAVEGAASKYGPQLREFVVTTAEDLERIIPDSGFGNVKLMAFDGALKVFIDAMKEEGEVRDEDVPAIWEFAHLLLEGYLAAKKAKNSVKN